MYSKDDILDFFEKVKDQIRSSMNKEIGYFLNMNAIMVQLLLHDAEKQTISLQVEVSQIENIQNMKEMNDFISSSSNLTFESNVPEKKALEKLGSISSVESLIQDNENLKHNNDILNQQIEILNNKIEMLTTENENLSKQNKETSKTEIDLRKQVQELTEKLGKNNQQDNSQTVEALKKLEKECQEAKKKCDEQIEKYQALVKSFDKKVSESAQFKTLKKILQDKNTLIVELKTKVAKYEKKE